MAESIHEISEAIGGLKATVSQMTDQWARQEAVASKSRHELYTRFENLSTQFTKLESSVTQAVKDIATMQPVIRLFEDGQQQKVGATKFGRFIWAAIIAIGTAVGGTISAIAWVLHQMFGTSPPHLPGH